MGTTEEIQQRVGPSAWDQVAATTLGVRPIITLHRSEVRNWEVQVDTKLKGKLIVKSQEKRRTQIWPQRLFCRKCRIAGQEPGSKGEGTEQEQRIQNPNSCSNKGARVRTRNRRWLPSSPTKQEAAQSKRCVKSFTHLDAVNHPAVLQISSQPIWLVGLFAVQAGDQMMTEECGCPAEI